MSYQQNLLERLENLLKWKKSKAFYSQKLGITIEEIDELLAELKQRDAEPSPVFTDDCDSPSIIENKMDYLNGTNITTVNSSKPLSNKEIEDLIGIDNINTSINRVWFKSNAQDKWTYSICTSNKVNNFYDRDELSQKIKELLPDYTPVFVPLVENYKEQSLFVYLSDDHVGSLMDSSLYGNIYNEDVYSYRLEQVYSYITSLSTIYENIFIISLGDQLNGWNSQTTRGGHEVKSVSNKEQFDMYIRARSKFYNSLFTSGKGKHYFLYNLENSNHSGLGFSYMANKALEFYINGKFPEVKTYSTCKAIDTLEYGNHVFAFTHGKDEKQQKIPFALNMTDKIDAYFYQYFDKHGYSTRTKELHVVKGDLHRYNINYGKSCRYVNIPSIMGSSEWSEVNFGDTRSGAVIEIVNKHSSEISSTPIWFT